jgi:1-acyl-sn-glycerol-3-phosphate acyltransferase
VIVLLWLRTVLGWGVILVATMVHAFLIVLGGESDFSEKVLRSWARLFLRVAGARLEVKHDAPLDPHKSYVFVSNHTSNLDAPAILAAMDRPMRFIAKKELSRIPVFGWAAKRMGHVFIDRKDSRAATLAIRRRIDKGLTGVALFFFAEGTRSTTDGLLPFKKGAAIAALETGLDCVPIAVAGARDVLKPKGLSVFRPGPVAVVFGAPIPVAGHTLDRRDHLVAVQREAVQRALDEARALVSAANKRQPRPPKVA